MKITGIHVLVLVVVLALCAHETSAGWGRVLRRITCGMKCGTRCVGIPPKCSWTCFKSCGRKRRSTDEGQMIPIARDYNAYLCNGGTEITLPCFKAVLKEDTDDVTVAFNAADTDKDGRLSLEEFTNAPFYFEGDEDGGDEGNGNPGDNGNKRELLKTLEELHNIMEE